MRFQAEWKGKRLRKYPFLSLEEMEHFVDTYKIPYMELTVYTVL